MPVFNFGEWIKKEMTSTACAGGGGSFTNDIARFSMPIFTAPIRRGASEEPKKKKKKRKKKKKD